MDDIIVKITENIPVVVGVFAGLVAVFVAIAKRTKNKKDDEVAAKLQEAERIVRDLTDGNPDIDPDNGK